MPIPLRRLLMVIISGLTACSPAAPRPAVLPGANPQPMPSSSTAPSEGPLSDETVVFTIPNDEPFSGREGDPRPDWLGWGAGAMDVAPDGSFWIADTAVSPQRLLHYSIHGVQMDEISMQGMATSIQDLVAGDGELWLLDLNAGDISVIHIALGRRELDVIPVPPDLYAHNGTPVANGIFSLQRAPGGGLVVSGISGLTLLVDASNKIVGRSLSGWSANGHIYRSSADTEAGFSTLSIDGRPVPMGASLSPEAEPFLGFNADGTFSIVLRREVPAAAGGEPIVDWMVAYLSAEGTVIGYAGLPQRMPWQEFNHELALGPEGRVYALISRADHSVQVVQLGFRPDRPAPLVVSPTSTATPLTPLAAKTTQLEGTLPADALDASTALISFFSDLSRGRFPGGCRALWREFR